LFILYVKRNEREENITGLKYRAGWSEYCSDVWAVRSLPRPPLSATVPRIGITNFGRGPGEIDFLPSLSTILLPYPNRLFPSIKREREKVPVCRKTSVDL
jgi:hypothetical protein